MSCPEEVASIYGKNTVMGDNDSEVMEGLRDPSVPGAKRGHADDPDYLTPPEAKRVRHMEQKAQEELSGRVMKVVDKELSCAIHEKQNEMDEIDNRILKLQQCLHTLRYCVSLNYYASAKAGEPNAPEKTQEMHPSVRKFIGKAPIQQSSSEGDGAVQSSRSTDEELSKVDKTITTIKKEPLEDLINEGEDSQNDSNSENGFLGFESSDTPRGSKGSSRPPSPKYLPPKPPDNPEVLINHGRNQRFQSKKRIVVGNTYQYLAIHAEEGDALRYKWQVYVRAPTQEEDVAAFISSVTFILDQSYAPHHMITLKNPPFILSRRGWGEFKLQIILNLVDRRNKPVRLVHPLVLSRPEDPLAMTGLWRLGQENWYDMWVYEPEKGNINVKQENSDPQTGDEESPAKLEKELTAGVVAYNVDKHVTVEHTSPATSGSIEKREGNERKELGSCKTEKSLDTQSFESKEKTQSSPVVLVADKSGSSPVKDLTPAKVPIINGAQGKLCKIPVRQPDGRVVPYFIPAHMYSLALKIAQNGGKHVANQKISPEAMKTLENTSLKTKDESFNKKPNENATSTLRLVMQGKEKVQNQTSKATTIPMKIFNISPTKGSTEDANHLIINPSPSGSSGTSGGPKLTLMTQGRQMVAKVSASNLTQTSLQELLLKSGGQDKKSEVVKKILSSISETKLASQTQSPDSQAASQKSTTSKPTNVQFMPIKIIQDKQTAGSSGSKIIKKPITGANIRFITNNGQLISASQLAKGLIPSQTRQNTPLTAESLGLKCIPTTSTSAKVNVSSPGVILMSNKQMVGNSNIQLLNVQGKTSQPSLIKCIGTTSQGGKTIQYPPLIVHSTGNTASNNVTSGSNVKKIGLAGVSLLRNNVVSSVNSVAVRNLLKPMCVVTTASSTTTTQVFTHATAALPSTLALQKAVNPSNYDKNSDLLKTHKKVDGGTRDEDVNIDQEWQERLGTLKVQSKACRSKEACINLWMKALPLVSPPGRWSKAIFPYCAESRQEFLKWPLGKQRAAEFQRAREVKQYINECGEGREWWTLSRIVAWARCHAFTPIHPRPLLRTDNYTVKDKTLKKSISYVGDFNNDQSVGDCDISFESQDEIDIEALSPKEQKISEKNLASPWKETCQFLEWEDKDTGEGCEWVEGVSSQLRLRLSSEVVEPGYKADAARATLWKATLSLMENLLRASHDQAWGEEVEGGPVVPPVVITYQHVLGALATSRPEFQLFTNYGLGGPQVSMPLPDLMPGQPFIES